MKKETIINAPITKVWEKIGGWCSIKDWHPAIVSCRPEQKGKQLRRFLESSDGGNARELFINKTDYSVTYFIEKSTLPLVGYKATIAVSPAGDNKTKITWSSNFKARQGTTDKQAKDFVIAFYKAGFEHIAKMF